MVTPIRRHVFMVASIVAIALLLPSVGRAADSWGDSAARCEPVFKTYRDQPLNLLQHCLGQWYQVRNPAEAKPAERSMVAEAAGHLYQKGNREQEYLARLLLSKLGISPPRKAPKKAAEKKIAKAPKKPKKPARKKYEPEEVSDRAQKRAKKIRKKGFKAFRKERYAKARKLFKEALSINPAYAQALYDLACVDALQGRSDDAVEYLRKLVDMGTKKALRRVQKARVDDDFRDLRDSPEFREVTGYVRIKIVNGVGEYGEDEVDRIAKSLKKLRQDVAAVGVDKAERKQPIIWYKAEEREARNAAYIIEKVINHPQTKLNAIDWDTEYDIIISWGDVIEKDDHGDPIVRSYAPSDPDDAEKKQQELLWEQDKALREPEKTARKVDHTIDTPDRMKRRGEAGVRRVEKTVKTLEKTGKKVQGLFK